jgi:hypothetical protein
MEMCVICPAGSMRKAPKPQEMNMYKRRNKCNEVAKLINGRKRKYQKERGRWVD